MAGTVDVRRAADRLVTTTSWLSSHHSFSFGDHYDPANTHHGLLMVNNDDTVAPAGGFDAHPHRDMEIVTWVVSGELAHRDSLGNSGTIYPGLAQRMSAGRGIVHSEVNGSEHEPVRFVQMWVVPDEPGGDPSYQQQRVDDALAGGGWVTVASGMPGRAGAVGIGNRHAALHAARLSPGDRVDLPVAPYLHLFVVYGRVLLADAGELSGGDAVRFTHCQPGPVTAVEAAEVLAWEMHAALGG